MEKITISRKPCSWKELLKLVRQKLAKLTSKFPLSVPAITVNIAVRVVEGDKERIQNYQGIVIARRGAGVNESFRVRKISNGVGVERVFPNFLADDPKV